VFFVPPRERKPEDLWAIKSLCDLYYVNPPVTVKEVKDARIHAVYIIDVDEAAVREIEPETYVRR
jgi:hypothetical protein